VKILVADSHELTRAALAQVLRDEGYEVVLAATGVQAMQIVGHQCVDLILADLDLILHTGTSVVRAVRQLAPGLPVLILTANATQDAQRSAQRLGADDFLNKPLDLDDVLQRVAFCLKPEVVAQLREAKR
jgi:CheY-like chemotaxis protein